jgi:hypothetical protein
VLASAMAILLGVDRFWVTTRGGSSCVPKPRRTSSRRSTLRLNSKSRLGR